MSSSKTGDVENLEVLPPELVVPQPDTTAWEDKKYFFLQKHRYYELFDILNLANVIMYIFIYISFFTCNQAANYLHPDSRNLWRNCLVDRRARCQSVALTLLQNFKSTSHLEGHIFTEPAN